MCGTLYTRRELKKLIIPLIIEQALAFSIGMIDTVMVSNIGESAVSGVVLVDAVNILMITMLMALATGGAVVAGQYLGNRQPDRANHAARQLIVSAFLFSSLIMALCLAFNGPILSTVFGEIDAQVMGNSRVYFYMTALTYPFIALFNSAGALCRSMGDSKTPMLHALIVNLVNVAGNALFIFVFNWGVFGAALSTLISRIIGSGTMLFKLKNPKREIFISSFRQLLRLDFSMIRRILRIGVPNGLENSMFQVGKIITTSLVALQGTHAIAAHAVSNSLALVEIIPGAAMGLATLSVVARCAGAKAYEQAVYYTKYLIKRSYLYLTVLCGVMLIFMKYIIDIYRLSGEAADITLQIMIIHSIMAIAIWTPAFTLPNALRAAGDVRYTMTVSITSMWLCRILLSYILVRWFGLGVIGIWLAMPVDWIFRSVFFMLRWRSGKWRSFQVV